MDALIRRSIASVNMARKNDLPWELDKPWKQSYHSYENGKWIAQQSDTSEAFTSTVSLALYSWNIDFMLPHGDARMRQALDQLEKLVSGQDQDIATAIFLQECTKGDLNVLASHSWVRQHFYLSDLDDSNWTSGYYGTATLIDKRLSILDCFRVHYKNTNMERDVFFTDIRLGRQVVRLGNSHLESMAFEPPMRPHQIALAARYMHEAQAAAIAGDFNAIQDFDRHLHSDNNLKDAFLELGGSENSEEGYTWGQQAATYQREQFGFSRMDKVFYCGALHLTSFERFGADVMVEAENEKAEILALGFEEPWITDHLGVKVVVKSHDIIEKI